MIQFVRDVILVYLNKHSLFNDAQLRFVPKMAPITNLVSSKEKVLALLDKKPKVDMVFEDLSKAFKILNHRLLIEKIEAFPIVPAV